VTEFARRLRRFPQILNNLQEMQCAEHLRAIFHAESADFRRKIDKKFGMF
jgi:hypothetical protein